MESKALRVLICQKLSDGRLPRNGLPRVWGSMGDGQQCLVCDTFVTKTEFVMEGQLVRDGRAPTDASFHVLCFHMWDDERQRPPAAATSSSDSARESDVATYKGHTIVTAATKERAGAWSVTVIVLDIAAVIVMGPCDLGGGGGVTFATKAIADEAGVLFGRAWIDSRT